MIYDLQKAGVIKRISAWVLDVIFLFVVVIGAAGLFAEVLRFEERADELQGYYDRYEKEYGVTFELTEEEFAALTKEEQDNYNAAYEALINDNDAMRAYNISLSLTFALASISILCGFIVTEFVLPLILKNGQTLGKKIFSLGVTRTNCVRITPVCLFIRAFLGKYTVETMIPTMVLLMLLFGIVGSMATTCLLVVLILLCVQIVLFLFTRNHSVIHDLMSDTAVVDMTSQMVFDSVEDLNAYKAMVARENAANQPY